MKSKNRSHECGGSGRVSQAATPTSFAAGDPPKAVPDEPWEVRSLKNDPTRRVRLISGSDGCSCSFFLVSAVSDEGTLEKRSNFRMRLGKREPFKRI